jgi:Fur family transcriptional regulator, ferric uptake regulator
VKSDLHVEVGTRLGRVHQRYTSKRRALVDIMAGSAQPMSIPEILDADRTLAQSSAYRNLATLEQAHVVRRVVTGDDFSHYELVEDLTEHHHHLVCSQCGRVEDVTIPPTLERRMERALDEVASSSGFSTVAHRLDLVGTCRDCA